MGFLDKLLGRSKKAAGRVREAAEDVIDRDKDKQAGGEAGSPPSAGESASPPPVGGSSAPGAGGGAPGTPAA